MPTNVEKLSVKDAQAKKKYTDVNGRKWSYIDSPAIGAQKGTAFFIHGFPDISFAWRYQIPLFNKLGFRVIALDCMGYGDTGTSSNIQDFSFKTHADAVAGIAKAINAPQIIIGGHDWGGAVVYRVAQWYPDLVTHVFSVCTAYTPVIDEYLSTEDLVKSTVPQFGYQLQFGSEDQKVEKVVNNEETIAKFLTGAYGGKHRSGRQFFVPEKGADLQQLKEGEFQPSVLFEKEEFDFYVKQFSKNGMNGPLNWYRTKRVNWEEDRGIPAERKVIIKQPVLYILANRDDVLTRSMSKHMEKVVPSLTRGEVPAAHWALWQTPGEVNAILKDWVEGVVLGGKSKI